MQAIVFALLSYFGWGVGDIFGTVAARRIPALSLTFWVALSGFIIASFYTQFVTADLQKLTLPIFILTLALGLLFIVGELAFNQALRVSNASIAETIGSSFPALVVVLSLVFLGERVSSIQLIAIGTIFVGIVLTTLNIAQIQRNMFKRDAGIRYALLCMVAWGVYFTFIKIPIKEIGWFWPTYIGFALFPLIAFYVKLRGFKIEQLTQKSLVPMLFSVVLLRGGDFSFNYAIGQGLTSVVAPIAGSYATLFVVLSFLIFKDPIKRHQILGIVVTLVGIVMLTIVTSR